MSEALSMSEQLIAMSHENDALVDENRALRAQISYFESPDDEGICRFCGLERNAPKGSVQKCYCIPTIRQYRENLAEANKRIELLEAQASLVNT